jgi:hypothetical protein
LNRGRFDCAGADRIKPPIDQAGRHGAGRHDSRPDEGPAIEVNGWIRDLTGGYFVRLFQQPNNG